MTLAEILIFFARVLSAEFLVVGMLFVSYSVISKYIQCTSVPLRWCATAVLGHWLSTLGFNILIGIGAFNIAVSTILLFILCLAVRLTLKISFSSFLSGLIEDAVWLRRVVSFKSNILFCLPYYVIVIFIFLTIIRTLILVPLGWDFITYHGPKAAMWVQNGNSELIHAPGGWSYYRNFFGGGESFIAWAMLPFHNDLLVCFVDSVQWLFLGLAVFTLGKEIGITARSSWIATVYVMFIPAVWLSVGSGYVELELNLSLLLGSIFLIKFFRVKDLNYLCLSGMAYGVAGGVKVTALPIVVLFILMSFVFILRRSRSKKSFSQWSLSLLFVLVSILPWMIRNLMETGSILDIPLTLAGIKLGQVNKALEWYQVRPGLMPYSYHQELLALGKIFCLPHIKSPHLSIFTLLPISMAFYGLWIVFKKNKYVGVFFTSAFIFIAGSFYFPNFSVVRILWASVSGRFLLPFIIPSIALSFLCFSRNTNLRKFYSYILLSATLINLFFNAFYGWSAEEMRIVFIVSLFLIFIIGLVIRISHTKTMYYTLIIIVSIVFIVSANVYKSKTRYETVLRCNVLHYIPKYWLESACKLDTRNHLNIAVTSGPDQNGDNLFMYYFMGSQYQNSIYYISINNSIQKNYELVDPRSYYKCARFEDWWAGIRNNQVDYVMSYLSKSKEYEWMKSRPDIFRKVLPEQRDENWALYKVVY